MLAGSGKAETAFPGSKYQLCSLPRKAEPWAMVLSADVLHTLQSIRVAVTHFQEDMDMERERYLKEAWWIITLQKQKEALTTTEIEFIIIPGRPGLGIRFYLM